MKKSFLSFMTMAAIAIMVTTGCAGPRTFVMVAVPGRTNQFVLREVKQSSSTTWNTWQTPVAIPPVLTQPPGTVAVPVPGTVTYPSGIGYGGVGGMTYYAPTYGGVSYGGGTYGSAGYSWYSGPRCPRKLFGITIPMTFDAGSVGYVAVTPGSVPAVNSDGVPYGTYTIQNTTGFSGVAGWGGGQTYKGATTYKAGAIQYNGPVYYRKP